GETCGNCQRLDALLESFRLILGCCQQAEATYFKQAKASSFSFESGSLAQCLLGPPRVDVPGGFGESGVGQLGVCSAEEGLSVCFATSFHRKHCAFERNDTAGESFRIDKIGRSSCREIAD